MLEYDDLMEKRAGMEKSSMNKFTAMQLAARLFKDKVNSANLFAKATDLLSTQHYVSTLPHGAQQQVLAGLRELEANARKPWYTKLRGITGRKVPAADPAEPWSNNPVKEHVATTSNPKTYGTYKWNRLRPGTYSPSTLEREYNIENGFFKGTNVPYRGDLEHAEAMQRLLKGRRLYYANPFVININRSASEPITYRLNKKTFEAHWDPIYNEIVLPSAEVFRTKPLPGMHPVVGKILAKVHPTIIRATHSSSSPLRIFRAIKEHEQGHARQSRLSAEALDREARETLAYTRPVLRAMNKHVAKTDGERSMLGKRFFGPVDPGVTWDEGINNFMAANPGSNLRDVYLKRFAHYYPGVDKLIERGGSILSKIPKDKLDRAKAAIEQMQGNYSGLSRGRDLFDKYSKQ